MTLQVGRGRHEHQRVILRGNLVEVAGEEYLVDVEAHTLQISGVVTQATEIIDAVVAAHIPSDMMGLSHHYLGYGRGPRTSTNDRYSTAVVHKASPPAPLQRARGVITLVQHFSFYSHYNVVQVVGYFFVLNPNNFVAFTF